MAITRMQQPRQLYGLGSFVKKVTRKIKHHVSTRIKRWGRSRKLLFKLMANSFINKKADLTTTDLTTLYTVPSFKSAVVKSLLVSEDAGSGTTITVTLVNSSGAIFNLYKDKAIASKATTELLTHPLVMEESEALKVQAADANELHVIASILEIQPREVT